MPSFGDLLQASRHIGDLFEDLRDGHNLISLLEVLSCGENFVSIILRVTRKVFNEAQYPISRERITENGVSIKV